MTSTAAQQPTRRPDSGVDFGDIMSGSGTTAVTRRILADAISDVEPAVAQQILSSTKWRTDYAGLLADLTRASARSAEDSVTVARAGLTAMRSHMVFGRGGHTVALAEALTTFEPRNGIGLSHISGRHRPVAELRVPYRGAVLRGDTLDAQLQQWVTAGVVEPSFATAINRVMAHPEWLALPGRRIAVIGAGAEMGPLPSLVQWGAHVVAVDVAAPTVWSSILASAEAGAGVVTVPTRRGGGYGLDAVTELPELYAWLAESAAGDALVVGMYAYADRGMHIRLTAAADTVAADLQHRRPDTALAYLATPTDAYSVTESIAEFARAAYRRRRYAALGRTLTVGRGFTPAYRVSDDGDTRHLADALVVQQGPSYAVAKRLQRWRGIAAAADQHRVSFNVAPPSWTRSVTRNRTFAAAYAGAHRFGAEIFEADTARTLMAALLVHDLHHRDDDSSRHPEDLFSDQAAHGGLWRAGFEPRSVLPLAAAYGLVSSLSRRRPAPTGHDATVTV